MSREASRLAAVVRQHAETARLLGVDFVPAYRCGNGVGESALMGCAPGAEAAGEIGSIGGAIVEVKSLGAASATERAGAGEQEPMARKRGTTRVEGERGGAEGKARLVAGGYAASAAARLPGWQAPAREAGETERGYKIRALAALRARYEADAPHQHFATDHHRIVWSDGDPMARVVFVGEAPGEDEDQQGVPFVGRAGQLLSKMISAMGLSREAEAGAKGVYICNVLKTRPPNNATPTSFEAGLCEPYLMEQLALVRPVCIVTLGLPATRTLLKTDQAMGKLRGQWQVLKIPGGLGGEAIEIAVMPTYHPAFLLRSYTPENRGKVWADLQMVMQRVR